jgi:hypothetical protein
MRSSRTGADGDAFASFCESSGDTSSCSGEYPKNTSG